MLKFHIWTIGCQMNKADSRRLAGELEGLGLEETGRAEDADVIVLNSCAVRQSAEDKVVNKLANMIVFKRKRPDLVLALTGCMVAADFKEMKQRFPHTDFFLRPQEFGPLLDYLRGLAPAAPKLASFSRQLGPTAFVPIIHGCNNFCAYCVVPYRRGRELSRTVGDILAEVSRLVEDGVREVTLLGQNVDSYGHDLSGKPDLAQLLTEVNRVEGLSRIRFLTSHPKDMTLSLIEAVASLEKVCEHISLPVQAGDDAVLEAMRRGYTVKDYRDLIELIRKVIPEVYLSTDVIVGFPGESPEQFERTYGLLEDIRFDTVHVAAYSPRPGTIASRDMADDVTQREKERRLRVVEHLQARISMERNVSLLGRVEEVLVEGDRGGKWQGRTRGDKLVFFEEDQVCLGKLVRVRIEHAGHWSLQGKVIAAPDLVEVKGQV